MTGLQAPVRCPFLSVIIIDHERREFVLAAVRSALDQSLARDRYEVLVVKDFEDEHIDAYLDDEKVLRFLTPDPGACAKFAIGIRQARGDVLCFLDDDDLFAHDKLAAVAKAFEEDPDLVYYHNDYRLIDGRGVDLPRPAVRYHSRRTIVSKDSLRISEGEKRTTLTRLKYTYPDFNNSSISILRSALLPNLPFLEREIPSADVFFFASAVLAPGSLLVDSRVLTSYRVHTGNLSFVPGLPSKEFFEQQLAARNRFAPGYEIILEMARQGGPECLIKSVEGTILLNEMYAIIQGKAGGRTGAMRVWIQALSLWPTYTVQSNQLLLLFCLAFAVSPKVARHVYYRWLTHG